MPTTSNNQTKGKKTTTTNTASKEGHKNDNQRLKQPVGNTKKIQKE